MSLSGNIQKAQSAYRKLPRLAAGLLLTLFFATPAWSETPVLRVLAWPGYAAPEVVKDFELQHGVRVEVSIITSDALLWKKISNRNMDYDVFAVNAAELQRYIASNLVRPIDSALIPNTQLQLARFRDPALIPGLVSAGKT